MRHAAFLIAAAGVFGICVQPAAAQFGTFGNMNQPYSGGGFGTGSPMYGGYNQGSTPALPPALSITGLGNPAVNYFNITRAEIDRRMFQGNMLQGMPGMGMGGMGQQMAPGYLGEVPLLPQTGHLASFGAYGTYYNYYGYGVQQRPYYPLNPMQARTLPR